MLTKEQRLVWEPLAPGSWRLCDPRYAEGEVQRLVAYVERSAGGGFEAVWISRLAVPSWHASRTEVLREAHRISGLDARAARKGARRSEGLSSSTRPDRHCVPASTSPG
ncbi:hypothetical protein [Agromyces sp. NPDC058110]|uniref:hypothetical protein n=1 Tax=Agromyces sp. NPDC058110 TaxID=3346345 RepID=UPI0036D7C72C